MGERIPKTGRTEPGARSCRRQLTSASRWHRRCILRARQARPHAVVEGVPVGGLELPVEPEQVHRCRRHKGGAVRAGRTDGAGGRGRGRGRLRRVPARCVGKPPSSCWAPRDANAPGKDNKNPSTKANPKLREICSVPHPPTLVTRASKSPKRRRKAAHSARHQGRGEHFAQPWAACPTSLIRKLGICSLKQSRPANTNPSLNNVW